MRMRAAKNAKKKKKNIILRIAFAAFAVYVVVQIVSLQIQLRNKKQEIEQLDADIQKQEPLKDKVENADTYLAEGAREQGYYLPGEQIFKVVPEN